MSVHIEDPGEVEGLLIDSVWIEVDRGSLQRYIPEHRSSSSSGVAYRWSSGDLDYLALAADVKAVRLGT